mgnify:CR=1 FL=1
MIQNRRKSTGKSTGFCLLDDGKVFQRLYYISLLSVEGVWLLEPITCCMFYQDTAKFHVIWRKFFQQQRFKVGDIA